jgi:hypothetical protein
MQNPEQRGRQASVDGFAHEHITAGILMKRYQNVSLVDLPLSPYDIIIVFKEKDETENIIRAQVKTAKKSISFVGGSRGGVDRQYKSGVKIYTQSSKTSDVVIGLHPISSDSFSLYFVPTCLIEKLDQKSLAINKMQILKDNYGILEKCKDRNFVLRYCQTNGII